MPLKCFVKVGNITNLSDARYCAGMGVDLLGFPVEEAMPGYVRPEAYQAIAGWIAGVQFVGEITDADNVNLTQLLQNYQLDWLQVSHTSDWQGLLHYQLPLICRVDWLAIGSASQFFAVYGQVAPHVSWFLLEAEYESMTDSTLSAIREIAEQYPVLLGFGIEPNTVGAAIGQTGAKGIALKGSEEIRPGYKDFGALADILEVLEDTE
jgi:phosphoribosylanthranilate isomerase